MIEEIIGIFTRKDGYVRERHLSEISAYVKEADIHPLKVMLDGLPERPKDEIRTFRAKSIKRVVEYEEV